MLDRQMDRSVMSRDDGHIDGQIYDALLGYGGHVEVSIKLKVFRRLQQFKEGTHCAEITLERETDTDRYQLVLCFNINASHKNHAIFYETLCFSGTGRTRQLTKYGRNKVSATSTSPSPSITVWYGYRQSSAGKASNLDLNSENSLYT